MAINVENKNAGWQKHEKVRNNATGTGDEVNPESWTQLNGSQ